MPSDPADRMFIAQRAHGNATEYVPTLAVLIVVCATLTAGWWLDALAIAAVAARALHAVGMLTSKTLASHGPVRDVGAMGTYAAGVALGRHRDGGAVSAAGSGQVSCWLAMFSPLTYRQTGTGTVAPARVTAS